MTNPKLILIRHGVTIDNRAGRLMGRNDSPMTQEAIDEAQALSSNPGLKKYLGSVDKIWSSPLPRAYRTAQLLLPDLSVEIEKAEELIERDFGVYNGEILDDLWKSNPDWPAAEGEYSTRPKGGESLADVEMRVFPFITLLDDVAPQDQHIVLVGHSTVWRLVAAVLNGRRQFPLVEKIAGPLSMQVYDRNDINLLRALLPEFQGAGGRG